MKKNDILNINVSNVIINYCAENKIHFNFCDPIIRKTFIFYKEEDAKSVLKFLFKEHRKIYYHLNAYYRMNKKLKDYESKIFKKYSDYLFGCVANIESYSISFDSYISIK